VAGTGPPLTARNPNPHRRGSGDSAKGYPETVTFWCVAGAGEQSMVANMKNVTPAAPARRALAALDSPPAADVATRRISKKVTAAIDFMVAGKAKTISEAAEMAGIARETLSRALNKAHIGEHLRQKVVKHLAINAARAGAVKVELLESANELVRDRSSSFVLGLAGIQPETTPSLNVNLEIKAGWVIDLSDGPSKPMIDVSPRETLASSASLFERDKVVHRRPGFDASPVIDPTVFKPPRPWGD
jgi:hypothetical protein